MSGPLPRGRPNGHKGQPASPLCMQPGEQFTNGPQVAPRFPTITAAIMHHVRAAPDAVAAVDYASSSPPSSPSSSSSASTLSPLHITYGELGRRSLHLMHTLREAGVRPGDRVPLVVKRGADMLVAVVGVLRCGAQYVPLDGGVTPAASLVTAVKQSAAPAVVVLESTAHRLEGLDVGEAKMVVVGQDGQDEQEEESDGEKSTTPDSGCYVIYTSGTTGTPKGVDVTHGNVANLVCSYPGSLGIFPGVRVGQVLNVSFDMAAWEILGCLSNGGTLVLRGSDWVQTLQEINVLICTPSILSRYNPQQFPNLKTVATAGEPVSQPTADLWATHLSYFNCCGPTETTIVNTMQRHTPGQPLSIGSPTPNNRVYILDADRQPVAIGQSGVMWAGGKGISRGYVGLPELTAQRYVEDVFAKDGTRMYNTGDVGQWQFDGTIKILGRCDDQVKVKGFRVELDGVTACVHKADGVGEASTLLVSGELHAFVSPGSCDVEAVRSHVERQMPYYARPSRYHVLDTFPLTANGKVDKTALRQLAGSCDESDSSADSSTVQGSAEADTKIGSDTKHASWQSGTLTIRSSASDLIEEQKQIDAQQDRDLEKGDLDDDVPDKKLPQPLRGLIYRVFIPYRFLFSVVWLANAAALVAVYVAGAPRPWLSNLVAINLAVAVVIRQDFVINALYTVCCSVPMSWPLWLRTSCAKIYHLGGVHSSAASCASLWLLAANINDAVCLASPSSCPAYPKPSPPAAALSWMLTAMFCSMLASAYPTFRKAHHDLFERWHRFMGWSMLAVFWAQTVVTAADSAKSQGIPIGRAVLAAPPFWLLLSATASVALSWFWLRRVPVISEVLSNHAVRLHFDYTVPVNGSFARLSFRPLIEWHSFATIPAPKPHGPPEDPARFPAGYSLVVSNAGDWTRSAINRAPSSVWVRGVPTCGVMRIATLFSRVVVVATGSGIGPCLGHIQSPHAGCATQLIWSTRAPERSFGKDLVDSIRHSVPGALIWDTDERGRPDMVRLCYNLARRFQAEAVIAIANEKITKRIVYGLETRGVAAYGAIWDS